METGIPAFSAIAGLNAYYYRAAGVVARERGIGFNDAQERLGDEIGASVGSSITPTRYRTMLRRSVEIVLRHPLIASSIFTEDFAILTVIPERRPLSAPSPGNAPAPVRVRRELDAFIQSPVPAWRAIYRSEFDGSTTYVGLFIFQLMNSAFVLIGVLLAIAWAARSWTGDRARVVLYICFPLIVALGLLATAAGAEAAARLRLGAVPALAIVAAVGWSKMVWEGRVVRVSGPGRVRPSQAREKVSLEGI